MKAHRTVALVLGLALLLGVLGAREWTRLQSIERYEHARRVRVLGYSGWLAKEAFEGELADLERAFEIPGGDEDALALQVATARGGWRHRTRWPGLLGNVYLFRHGGTLRFTGRSAPGTGWEAVDSPAVAGALDRERSGGATGGRARSFVSSSVPALVLPTPPFALDPEEQGWIVLELDARYLGETVFPDLLDLFFPPPTFDEVELAVVEPATGDVLYSSSPLGRSADFGRVDVSYGLGGRESPAATRPGSGAPARTDAAIPSSSRPRTAADQEWFRRFWDRLYHTGEWRLLVRQAGEPVEAAVAAERRRESLRSVSLLGLLAASLAAVVLLARRTRRLAARRMELVAGFSHELRTPVAILGAAAENLADDVVNDRQKLVDYTRVIRKETRRLQEMVENVLHVARRGTPAARLALEPIDVREVIEQSLRRAENQLKEAGFDTEVDLPRDPVWVRGNARALESALTNLVSNAVKYAGDLRRLRVEVTTTAGENGTPVARIAVEDRGPGIEPDEAGRLFEPFYRGRRATDERREGSGLGLAVVRDIVVAHRGQVAVRNRPGGGSSFDLRFPLAGAPR